MSTKGFLGFKKESELKGWILPMDAYFKGAGLKVLRQFEKYSNKELINFFINHVTFLTDDKKNPDKITFIENTSVLEQALQSLDFHRKTYSVLDILDQNWKRDFLQVNEESDFIKNGSVCRFAYIFNLDNDTVEVFRGGYEIQQVNGLDNNYEIPKPTQEEISRLGSFILDMYEYDIDYTHQVGTVTRENVHFYIELFRNWDTITENLEGSIFQKEFYLDNIIRDVFK